MTADALIDEAYAWLCYARRHWPVGADIWDLRHHWDTVRPQIQQALFRGEYRFEPLSRVTRADGETVHVWSARDALVLKLLATVLADYLPG